MMGSIVALRLSLDEMCEATDTSFTSLLELVEHGIVDPEGDTPANWLFERQNIAIIRRAYRLHDDLNIDWPGIALAMDLLNELESLRAENHSLKRRLKRFIND